VALPNQFEPPVEMSQPSPESMQVNGFYGPGAWATWIITMVASWISLLRDDYTHNLHFIGYAMYTNWATIDFIRHGSQAPSQDRDDLSDQGRARLHNIAASMAVIHVGLYQVVTQLVFCVNSLMREPESRLKARRCLVLLVGALLPCSLFCSAYIAPSALGAWQTLLNSSLPPRCYFVPCAPQSIGESDQAFALAVALYFFLYEFGYEFWNKVFRIRRKAARGVQTTWPRTVV